MKWLYRLSLLSLFLSCALVGCHFADAVRDVQDGTINVPAGIVGAVRALAGDPTGALEAGGVLLTFVATSIFGHKATKRSAAQIATDVAAAAVQQLRAELVPPAAPPPVFVPYVQTPPATVSTITTTQPTPPAPGVTIQS
jgi:hypothetical protein